MSLLPAGRCPACGAPSLYAGVLRFADRCARCGLDFTRFNVGDGPAAFLTLLIGAAVVVGSITLQLAADPPIWVHLVLWPPLTLALVVGLLRVSKAALLGAEYRTAAREGRLRP